MQLGPGDLGGDDFPGVIHSVSTLEPQDGGSLSTLSTLNVRWGISYSILYASVFLLQLARATIPIPHQYQGVDHPTTVRRLGDGALDTPVCSHRYRLEL